MKPLCLIGTACTSERYSARGTGTGFEFVGLTILRGKTDAFLDSQAVGLAVEALEEGLLFETLTFVHSESVTGSEKFSTPAGRSSSGRITLSDPVRYNGHLKPSALYCELPNKSLHWTIPPASRPALPVNSSR